MTSTKSDMRIVVIGGGHAGFEVCAKLRALGIADPISLISAEDVLPYQRPPLSKAYVLGDMSLDRLYFRPGSFYEAENIDLRLRSRCTAIDRAKKTVALDDGTCIQYTTLVIATGASPIRLPDAQGGALNHVHYVRSLEDADCMAKDFQPGKSALIVGGGYIGLEAASVARARGMSVTLIDASDRILSRVAAAETSSYFRDLHIENGVDVREGVQLERLIGEDGQLSGADLSDGTQIAANVAIIGIGVRPDQNLAESAGLDIEDGIKVDAQLRTSDPDIFAIGDCASFPYKGSRLRLESVGNAIDQAQLVAAVIAGHQRTYHVKPWFWSDQFGVKLQIAGLSAGYDTVVIRRGIDGGRSHWYYVAGRLTAIDAIDDPRAYMVAKRLIENGKSAAPARVEDPEADLKQLLKKEIADG